MVSLSTARFGDSKSTAVFSGIFYLFAILSTVTVIFYAISYPIDQAKLANLVLGLATATYYFNVAREQTESDSGSRGLLYAALSGVLALAILAATLYVHVSFDRWLAQGSLLIYNDVDLVVGFALIAIVTHVTYKEYGGVLAAVVLTVIVYGLTGDAFPSILQHSGYSFEELIARQTVAVDGVYGFILEIMATWVAIFLILAGLTEEYGGFDYITEAGMMLAQKSKSALVQTAVISSMIVGMMMGAAVANVAITGSFTIPLMKDRGIPARVAGAVESVASTGGQILPPIMGLAAFLMADIIGVPFPEIVRAGLLPALLFYVVVALGIHFYIKKNGWGDTVTTDLSLNLSFVVKGLQYLIPMLVLIYVLLIEQMDPLAAGKYTIASMLLTTAIRYSVIDRAPKEWARDTVKGLIRGGEILAPFLALGGALGIIINIYSSTGLGQKIALNLMLLAGGVIIVALLIVMVVSILFGMGMPTPAAYVLVATILAPALVRLGYEPLVSHMFVFYFALLSALTPPVAVPVAMSTTISGAGFWETVKTSLRFGGWLFLIPYMFVVNPSLIIWSFPTTLIEFTLVASGCVGLVMSSTGYNGVKQISTIPRLVVLALGLVAIFVPYLPARAAGFLGILVFVVFSARRIQFTPYLRSLTE